VSSAERFNAIVDHARQLGLEFEAQRLEAATLAERFEQFHAANPHVYAALVRRARRAKARGYRPGIQCLFELLRWSHGMSTRGDEFLLNNNFAAYYARAIMAHEPDLEGFFEVRRLRSTTTI
jgi:hypothetical protein